MRSKLGFLLPSVYQGNETLEKYLQTIDAVILDIQKRLQSFPDELLPDNAPDDWLYWLFWALGGEKYYRNDFTEAEKRKVLKNLFALYASKGTIEGIKKHIDVLSTGKTVFVYNAPDKSFLSASLTQEEREQYEANFREVRICPEWTSGTKQTMFIQDFLINCFPATTDAASRLYGKVTIYDPLTSTEEDINTFSDVLGSYVEIHKPGEAWGIFPGKSFLDVSYLYPQQSTERFFIITLSGVAKSAFESRQSLGMRPLRATSIYYRERYIPGTARGMFPTTILHKQYTVPSTAKYRILKYFRIFEKERAVYSRRAAIHYIGQKIGVIPAFQAEVGVELSRIASKFEALTQGFLHRRFFYKSDAKERIERARWAANLARAAGIKITLDTFTKNTIRARNTTVCGRYVCGQTTGGV